MIEEKVVAVVGAKMPRRIPKDDDASAGCGAPAEVDGFDGANAVFHEPWSRFGDLFPLPVPADCGFPGPSFLLSSRRAQQRVVRRRRLLELEAGTVGALNHLAGFSDPSQWPVFPKNRLSEGDAFEDQAGPFRSCSTNGASESAGSA